MGVMLTNTSGLGLGQLFAIVSLLTIGYLVTTVIYNVYFHPLRNFPGPFWMRASRVPHCYLFTQGCLTPEVLKLHRKYGEVVRIAPDELAFASGGKVWRDIMGHRGPGLPEMSKSPHLLGQGPGIPKHIINAGREEHTLLRRSLAQGFSDRSMRAQEPMIMKYVDLLMMRLKENGKGGTAPVDAVQWYNYTTFDVIGDLAFGEPFGCLEKSEYHPWVAMVFQSMKAAAYLQAASYFPWFKLALAQLIPKSLVAGKLKHLKLTREKVLKRMNLGAERPDLIEGLLRKKDQLGMDVDKLQSNSDILIVAGSETTATLLSGVTFLLATHPEPLAKLTAEVRSTFATEEEINFTSASKLQYMLACLNEALRVYPPTPAGLPRVVPEGGATIADYYVPQGTLVAQHQYAIYHYEKLFNLPDEFIPERWTGDPRFADDDRDACQPFSYGTRDCIGRNLAYVEMRVILGRLLWNYDLVLAEDSKDWMSSQQQFLLWEKGPLNIFLKPRQD